MNRSSKKRVIIRPPAPGDCSAFIAAVRRSRSFHRSRISPKPATTEAFKCYLKRYSSRLHQPFCVFHRETGDIVGVINLNNVIRGVFQSASVGYFAFKPYAGQGLMHEGLLLVLKQAFHKLKLHRIEAEIQPNNHASIALVKKCGFVKEGFARRFAKVCGRWRDHERWAIRSEDFLKNK